MANYLTTDSELISIADAIRIKGGTSESLIYPDGFISAINDISGGSINWNALAEPIKSVNHIYSGVNIDSNEAFNKAVNFQTVKDTTLISRYNLNGNLRFASNSTTKLPTRSMVMSASLCYFPASLSGKVEAVTMGTIAGQISHASIIGIGSSHVSYRGYKYNLTTASVSLVSTAYGISFSLYYKTEYNPYVYSSIQWYHGLNDDIYLKCSVMNAASPGFQSITNGKYWAATSFSTVKFTPDTIFVPSAAFYCLPVRSIESVSNIQSIGASAFYSCSLLNGPINFPSCTSVGANAFYRCVNITSVNMSQCSYITGGAFDYCIKLSNVSIPVCSVIGNFAFRSCTSLSYIYAPSCTTISSSAFYACTQLINANMPQCTYIGSYAFANCTNLTNINAPLCLLISSYAFNSCTGLTSVSFSLCSCLGSNAFAGCTSLSLVSLNECSMLNNNVFYNCQSLYELYLLSTSIVSIGNSVFYGTPLASDAATSGKIYVPNDLLSDYLDNTTWSVFSNHLTGI